MARLRRAFCVAFALGFVGACGGSSTSPGGGSAGGQPFTAAACEQYPRCDLDMPCASGSCIAIDDCPTAICISPSEACTKRCGTRQCAILESYPEQISCEADDPVTPRTCETVRSELEAELGRVRSCSAAAECGQVIAGSSCGCTRDLVSRNDADLTRLQALMAERIDGESCNLLGSTCDCPEVDGFACNDGVCGWSYR